MGTHLFSGALTLSKVTFHDKNKPKSLSLAALFPRPPMKSSATSGTLPGGPEIKPADQKNKPRSIPVRPTVATLLRQHQAVLTQSKEEKAVVKGFSQGGGDLTQHWKWASERRKEEQKRHTIEDTKRILKAKLAFHKAIEASEQVVNQKYEAACDLRKESLNMKEELRKDTLSELAQRKQLIRHTNVEDHAFCREILPQLKKERQISAKEMKNETRKLQEFAKHKLLQEQGLRKERIQQIQAAKAILKESMQSRRNGSSIINVGGDAEDKLLKLRFENGKRDLEEKQRRVKEMREERDEKLQKLRQDLDLRATVREKKASFKTLPGFQLPNVDFEDPEIKEMTQKLNQLKRNGIKRK